MQPSVNYLNKLRDVIQQYPDLPCSSKLLTMVDSSQKAHLTVEALNNLLLETLHKKSKGFTRVKETLIPKRKKTLKNRTTLMENALKDVMRSHFIVIPNLSKQNITLYTPDSFAQALYERQSKFEYDVEDDGEETKINNAIVNIKNDYQKHHDAYKSLPVDSPAQTYHARRLAVIWGWLTTETFGLLINCIKQTKLSIPKSDFSLALTDDDIKNVAKEKQHLLSWIGIIFEEFEGSESPYAMSEVLRILSMCQESLNKEKMAEIVHEMELFKAIYMDEKSLVPSINIEGKHKKVFIETANTLALFEQAGNLSEFDETLKKMKQNLKDIYSDLAPLVRNANQTPSILENLTSSQNPNHPSHRSSTRSTDVTDTDIPKSVSTLVLSSRGRTRSTTSSYSNVTEMTSISSSQSSDSIVTISRQSLDQTAAMPVGSSGSSKSTSTVSQETRKQRPPTPTNH